MTTERILSVGTNSNGPAAPGIDAGRAAADRSAGSAPRTMVFDLFVDEAPLYLRVAERVAAMGGVRTLGVTLGKRYDHVLDSTTVVLHNLADFCDRVWETLDTDCDLLNEYETRYGNPFLSWVLHADRFLSNYTWYSPRYTPEHGVKFVIASLMFWEDVVRREGLGPGDVIIVPGVAFIPHIAAYLVARRHGIAFWDLFISRERIDQFVISDGLTDCSSSLRDRFRGLLARPLTEVERESAEAFLAAFRTSRAKPQYMENPTQHRRLESRHVRWFLERSYNYYVRDWRSVPFDFVTLHPVRYAVRDLVGILLAKYLKAARIYDVPRPKERYVFFPLQLQPEATTMIWAPYWDNQVAVVENLAKTIPLGCKLYVKEHYSSLGRRSLAYYRQLRRLPNVRLITPFADSHELIQGAEAIVTLTSTVGWEALLYEKPVVTLGEVFYNLSGLNVVVPSFQEIGPALREVMTGFEVDRERLLKFIVAVRAGYLDGDLGLPHVRTEVMRSENVDRIARSLLGALVAV